MIKAEAFFKALSDGTRLRLLLLLQDEESLCVCELVHALDTHQPLVSRHLAQLRDMGVVEDERRGQWVYYRLSPGLPDWAEAVLHAAAEAESLRPFRRRLHSMPNRPIASCS